MSRPEWWRHRIYFIAWQIQFGKLWVIVKRPFVYNADLVPLNPKYRQVLERPHWRSTDRCDFVCVQIQTSYTRVYIGGYLYEIFVGVFHSDTIYSSDHQQ